MKLFGLLAFSLALVNGSPLTNDEQTKSPEARGGQVWCRFKHFGLVPVDCFIQGGGPGLAGWDNIIAES